MPIRDCPSLEPLTRKLVFSAKAAKERVGLTTESAETGSAGRGRRLEIFASRLHRPLAPSPHTAGGLPVPGPKGISSNCLPCPAKRVSAWSVVNLTGAVPIKTPTGERVDDTNVRWGQPPPESYPKAPFGTQLDRHLTIFASPPYSRN